MNEDLPISISGFSENYEMVAIEHFFASVGWGALSVTVPLIAAMIASAGSGVGVGSFFFALAFVGAVVAMFTALGLFLIGLPLTFVLSKAQCEYTALYAACGGLAGFLILAGLFGFPNSAFGLPLFGAIAGAVCAFRWGRWRKSAAHSTRHSRERLTKRSNPIHDLTH